MTTTYPSREYVDASRKGCKFCGSKAVAWNQNDEGRWYLTEVFEDASGRTYTERTELHSSYCAASKRGRQTKVHASEQATRLAAEEAQVAETATARKRREERQATEEAEYFIGLHDLCKENRSSALDQLGERERELVRIQEDPTSMDYMTEHLREQQRMRRLRAEIAFMRAALGMSTEYDDAD